MITRRDLLWIAGAAATGCTTPAKPGPGRDAAPGPETAAPGIAVRHSAQRGHANHGWLDTYHTFSFASYQDPRFSGFRSLRVINEDRVHPGKGFPTHPHKDMEIITYVLSGALEHKDSMGNGSIIRPDDVQKMSAGKGITHSEYNASSDEGVHFLQIWIVPDEKGIEPGYQQERYAGSDKGDRLRLVASRDGREGSIRVRQDVSLFASTLASGKDVTHRVAPGRYAWLQVARGGVSLNGRALLAGDGAAVSGGGLLTMRATLASEILLFDLA